MSSMGIGKLGDKEIVFRHRKFRYTLSGEFPSGIISERFVKLNYKDVNNNTFMSTYFDASNEDLKELWDVIADMYKLLENKKLTDLTPEELAQLKGNVTVKMYDGTGNLMETYNFEGVFAQSINFGDLDFSSSEECTVEITWHYDKLIWRNEMMKTEKTYPEIRLNPELTVESAKDQPSE